MVKMVLNNHTARTLKKVFDEFTDDDLGFSKTVVPVKLAQYGEDQLVSRSQAKRLLNRVDRFRTVLVDFEGVDSIGPSYADEIFRVFVNEHPEVSVVEINVKPQVAAMIARARAVR